MQKVRDIAGKLIGSGEDTHTVITGRDITRQRKMLSLTIDAAAAVLTRRLGRKITVNILAGMENGFISVPKDLALAMLEHLDALVVPTATDPRKLWRQIEDRLKPSALAAAKAICQMRDDGDHDKPCPCVARGETACRAFEMFGREAVASTIAIDRVQQGHLHAGVYAIDWKIVD